MSDQDLRPRFDIRAVQFDDDGVQIQYMHLPNDVRFKGALVATHTLTVSGAEVGWHNEVEDLKNAAYHLLADALEDFNDADPVDLEDIYGRDDDNEKGMGE